MIKTVYYISPIDSPGDQYAAGYDGNFFRSKEQAEDAVASLQAAIGGEWQVQSRPAISEDDQRRLRLTGWTCERCGRKHLGSFVWLELNKFTGHFHTPGRVPAEASQGLFKFGRTCSSRALGYERLEDYKREHPDEFDENGQAKWRIARKGPRS